MTAYSVRPCWARITINSPQGDTHVTIPTVPLINLFGTILEPVRFDLRGGALPVDAFDALNDFCNDLSTAYPSDCTIVGWELHWFPEGASDDIIAISGSLSVAGSLGASVGGVTWKKAVQKTLSFRCEDGSIFKLVLQNVIAQTFERTAAAGMNAGYVGIVSVVTNTFSFIASRKGGRPVALRQITTTLNEALRKKYGMD